MIRVGGFFSGIGAHHSALERIKESRPGFEYEMVFQCEFDPITAKAYDVIHGRTLNLGDITAVDNIGGSLAVDILFWTPPCQDISIAGRLQGNDEGSGTRSALAFEVPRILANTPERERPKYLVFEEVATMLSDRFMQNFKALVRKLQALGYRSKYGIMNAADYGVAQYRKRCFMISKYHGTPPDLPTPVPLNKKLSDYLDEEVDNSYYLSDKRIQGLIWSTEKEKAKGNNFGFSLNDGGHRPLYLQ